MATTQQDKPKNGNGKAVVTGLRPLNLNTAKTRVRRTSDQVLASRIKKQTDLAEKAANRAKLLAQRQERQAERARAALEEAERIEQAAKQKREDVERRAQEDRDRQAAIAAGETPRSSTVPVVAKTPQIEKMLTDLQGDFDHFYEYVKEKYGVTFEGTTPELVKRGYISVKMRGSLTPQMNEVSAPVSDTGVAREAVRFMQFYKEVGLTPAWLNKEVRLKDDEHTYILSGLRGKAHAIVLRRKDTQQAFTMSSEDFKKALQEEVV